MAKRTHASVTEQPCTCGYLERWSKDPASRIVYNPQVNEYWFVNGDLVPDSTGEPRGYFVIYHCPFCGGTAPESKRGLLIATVHSDEQQRLFELVEGLKSLEQAIHILGPPDNDNPHGSHGPPPMKKGYRTLTYTRLSSTANLVVIDDLERGVMFVVGPKHIGPSPEQPKE